MIPIHNDSKALRDGMSNMLKKIDALEKKKKESEDSNNDLDDQDYDDESDEIDKEINNLCEEYEP